MKHSDWLLQVMWLVLTNWNALFHHSFTKLRLWHLVPKKLNLLRHKLWIEEKWPKYCHLPYFFVVGHSRPLFLYFRLFNTANSKLNIPYRICWCLDSNRGPLVFEATTLPTEPQPLPKSLLPYLKALYLSASPI